MAQIVYSQNAIGNLARAFDFLFEHDQANANAVSEFVVESKNPTAWGTSRGMIEDHADKIVETLTNGK